MIELLGMVEEISDQAESHTPDLASTDVRPRSKRSARGRTPYDVTAGAPIVGFTGVNGAGKTLFAVASAIADFKKGIPVYSTVDIDSPYGKSQPIVSVRQLLTLRDCTVLLDEVHTIFSSRSTSSLPNEIIVFLHTLRHRNVRLIWTAPTWMRADILIREVTQAVVNVAPLGKLGKGLWPRPILVLCGVLDATTGTTDAAPERVLRRRVLLPTRSAGWGAYDTHSDTPLIGYHGANGTCVDCGGTIKRESCSPARHESLGMPWVES